MQIQNRPRNITHGGELSRVHLRRDRRVADRQQLAGASRICLEMGQALVVQIRQNFQFIVVGPASGRFPECPLDLTVETGAAFLKDSLTESARRFDE